MPNETDAEQLLVLVEARIRDFEKNMQKAAATGERTYTGLKRGSRSATQQMADDMQRSTNRINQALAQSSVKIGAYAKAFAGGLLAGGATALIASAGKIVRSIAEIGDEAARAGLKVKAFQEWKFVADQARIPIDGIVDAFKELNIRADEFVATGKGSAAEAFARLGMSREDIQARLRDPSALMVELIERTKALKNTAAGTRIFDELFGGTGGERLVKLLKQSEGELENTIRRAEELGLVLDDDVIAKADELDRKFRQITATVAGGLKTAIVEVAEAMGTFLDSFRAIEAQQTETIRQALAAQERLLATATAEPSNLISAVSERLLGGATAGYIRDVQAEIDRLRGVLRDRALADPALRGQLAGLADGGAATKGNRIGFVEPVADTEKARRSSTRAIREEAQAVKDARAAHDLYLETLELERDLLFERQQLFRDPVEQRVYGELHQLGIEINSVRGQQLATEIRTTERLYQQVEALEDIAAIGADLFAEPLRDGENMFDRLISRAADFGAALQKAVGGKAGAGIGGALSGLGSGYSSGDPLMGALGGALSGASAGFAAGPIGALIGGGAGLIGGIIGGILGQEKKRAEEAKASAAAIVELERQLAEERRAIQQQQIEKARADLRAAYDREASGLRDLASAHSAFAANLRQSLDALRLNPALTGLSPGQRLAEAERQYEAARAGGAEADLGGAMQRFAEEAISYYGATAEYFRILERIEREGTASAAVSESIASNADLQLKALEAQYGPLLGIEQNTLTTAQAMAALVAAGGGPTWGSPGSASGQGSYEDGVAIRGFATGGDFTVGGSGGTDSQMVRFRATPGERVSIRTPQQAGNDNAAVVAALRAGFGELSSRLNALERTTRFGIDERKRKA